MIELVGLIDERKIDMAKLDEQVKRYTDELKKGYLQDAYRGIMGFIAGLKADMAEKHPEMTIGALYQGYMDMTFFTFTPETLKRLRLKVAIVYLHEKNCFEAWLSGANRQVQSDFLDLLKEIDLAGYELSYAAPGVDSIISFVIADDPDFNDEEALRIRLEDETMRFMADMEKLVMTAKK